MCCAYGDGHIRVLFDDREILYNKVRLPPLLAFRMLHLLILSICSMINISFSRESSLRR